LGLELVVEVKFWYRGKSVKDLTEEIAADLTLYLRKDSPYRAVIAAIWDDGTYRGTSGIETRPDRTQWIVRCGHREPPFVHERPRNYLTCGKKEGEESAMNTKARGRQRTVSTNRLVRRPEFL
jgi:hypothetical protein